MHLCSLNEEQQQGQDRWIQVTTTTTTTTHHQYEDDDEEDEDCFCTILIPCLSLFVSSVPLLHSTLPSLSLSLSLSRCPPAWTLLQWMTGQSGLNRHQSAFRINYRLNRTRDTRHTLSGHSREGPDKGEKKRREKEERERERRKEEKKKGERKERGVQLEGKKSCVCLHSQIPSVSRVLISCVFAADERMLCVKGSKLHPLMN